MRSRPSQKAGRSSREALLSRASAAFFFFFSLLSFFFFFFFFFPFFFFFFFFFFFSRETLPVGVTLSRLLPRRLAKPPCSKIERFSSRKAQEMHPTVSYAAFFFFFRKANRNLFSSFLGRPRIFLPSGMISGFRSSPARLDTGPLAGPGIGAYLPFLSPSFLSTVNNAERIPSSPLARGTPPFLSIRVSPPLSQATLRRVSFFFSSRVLKKGFSTEKSYPR